jgi:predicted ferric reductase
MLKPQTKEFDDLEPVVPLPTALLILVITAVLTLGTLFFLEQWLPGIGASLFGPKPTVFWDLARSSAFAAYLLIWLSVVFGLLITNRLGRSWFSVQAMVDLHQFSSLLGLAFGLFHGLILLGDQYIGFTPLQVVIPFASSNYQPFWVGLGQLALYLTVVVSLSFYVRKAITPAVWRAIHYVSFILYAFITVHGLLAGSDTLALPVLLTYVVTSSTVFLLMINRLSSWQGTSAPAARASK